MKRGEVEVCGGGYREVGEAGSLSLSLYIITRVAPHSLSLSLLHAGYTLTPTALSTVHLKPPRRSRPATPARPRRAESRLRPRSLCVSLYT